MTNSTCTVCGAPSTCNRPNLALLQCTCTACGWHHSLKCECGTTLCRYDGAGPVSGMLCPVCDEPHASELEVVS